ncbi:hypothetical protein LCGC14_1571030, partial [marine sediment metagenome]
QLGVEDNPIAPLDNVSANLSLYIAFCKPDAQLVTPEVKISFPRQNRYPKHAQ